MNFQAQLNNMLTQVPGGKAAVMMGFDGIPVVEVKADGFDLPLQDICVEYSQLLSQTGKIGQGNDLGGLSELTVALDRFRFVFRVIDANYFLVMVLTPEGNVGKSRFLLRRSLPEIRAEL